MLIRFGHRPDPDAAFLFWALAEERVDTRGFEFEPVVRDIQTLNEWALESRLEASAISLHAYPQVQDRYVLLPHGATMGPGRGPIVVASRTLSQAELRDVELAVPGELTTAFLVLRMWLGDFRYRVVPAGEIADEVASGRAEAGLMLHDGGAPGLQQCVDLGLWWLLETGLPLPLGVNVARRDIADEGLRDLSAALRDSIQAAVDNRDEAMRYALRFGTGFDRDAADRFLGTYVNDFTCDYGEEGRQAVRELLKRAETLGLYDHPVRIEFVE